MSLDKYTPTHQAARAKITLPVPWPTEKASAYFTLEKDLADWNPEKASLTHAQEELLDAIQEVVGRRAPAPQAQKPVKRYECFKCHKEIRFGVNKEKLDLDGKPHIC